MCGFLQGHTGSNGSIRNEMALLGAGILKGWFLQEVQLLSCSASPGAGSSTACSKREVCDHWKVPVVLGIDMLPRI